MFSKTLIEEKNQTAVWGFLTKKSRQCCWISPLTDWRLQRRLDFLSCAMMLPSINHRKFNRKISWKCTLGGGIERDSTIPLFISTIKRFLQSYVMFWSFDMSTLNAFYKSWFSSITESKTLNHQTREVLLLKIMIGPMRLLVNQEIIWPFTRV